MSRRTKKTPKSLLEATPVRDAGTLGHMMIEEEAEEEERSKIESGFQLAFGVTDGEQNDGYNCDMDSSDNYRRYV